MGISRVIGGRQHAISRAAANVPFGREVVGHARYVSFAR